MVSLVLDSCGSFEVIIVVIVMVLVDCGVEPGCPVIEVVSSEPAVVDVPEVVDVGFDAENFNFQ